MGELQEHRAQELIGIAVSGATRCRYCVYFHTGAVNASQYDYEQFTHEVDQITAYITRHAAAPA